MSFKHRSFFKLGILLALFIINNSCKTTSINDGFYPIFNGENLEGWSGDSTYWSVKDGVLIGEVTPEIILKRNSFIIYEKEQPSNFELKLQYIISKN